MQNLFPPEWNLCVFCTLPRSKISTVDSTGFVASHQIFVSFPVLANVVWFKHFPNIQTVFQVAFKCCWANGYKYCLIILCFSAIFQPVLTDSRKHFILKAHETLVNVTFRCPELFALGVWKKPLMQSVTQKRTHVRVIPRYPPTSHSNCEFVRSQRVCI